MWNIELTGPAFHTGDCSEARAPLTTAVVVAPAGHETVTAVGATAPTVVGTTATVLRTRAAALALARTARTGRPTTMRLGTGDEALELVLGDRDTARGRRTGRRDDRIAGRGPHGRDLETGVLELTLHRPTLVRQGEGHDGAPWDRR